MTNELTNYYEAKTIEDASTELENVLRVQNEENLDETDVESIKWDLVRRIQNAHVIAVAGMAHLDRLCESD